MRNVMVSLREVDFDFKFGEPFWANYLALMKGLRLQWKIVVSLAVLFRYPSFNGLRDMGVAGTYLPLHGRNRPKIHVFLKYNALKSYLPIVEQVIETINHEYMHYCIDELTDRRGYNQDYEEMFVRLLIGQDDMFFKINKKCLKNKGRMMDYV
jgi:hypothetical protein